MSAGRTLRGTYGSMQTPCVVYEYLGWYAVEGSKNVNLCEEFLHCWHNDNIFYVSEPVNVETLSDIDTFTLGGEDTIETVEDLERQVEELASVWSSEPDRRVVRDVDEAEIRAQRMRYQANKAKRDAAKKAKGWT